MATKADVSDLIAHHEMNVAWTNKGSGVYVSGYDRKNLLHGVRERDGDKAANLERAVTRLAAEIDAANRGVK